MASDIMGIPDFKRFSPEIIGFRKRLLIYLNFYEIYGPKTKES